MADPVRLAELVCSRFSHDLSGLLGSLSGVLELIVESQSYPGEELALATETATELMYRLRMLRAAWGGLAEPIDKTALGDLSRGMTGGGRVKLDLDGMPDGTVLAPAMARVVLNLWLLAIEAMPRGGVLALSGDEAGHVVARITGPDAAWPPGFTVALVDEAQAWAALSTPRDLQAPLTALIARSLGVRVSPLMAAAPASAGPPPLLLSPTPG